MVLPRHARALTLVLLSASVLLASAERKGVRCRDHPLYRRGFRGEIIRSWTFTRKQRNKMYFTASGYYPRYDKHAWAPLNSPRSRKYRRLDLFACFLARNHPDRYLTMYFNRPAKVYLFVHTFDKRRPRLFLQGWRPEGWVKKVKGSGKVNLGVTKPMLFSAPGFAYVFSKPARRRVILPSKAWLKRNVRGARKVEGTYHVMVGERNGRPVRAPRLPSGRTANAGRRCPRELHDSWKAPASDRRDPQMRGRRFRISHPLWDPCFWCAFDHEHGSMPKQIMGYEPLFGYVALKNKREGESHNGFKNMVLDAGNYWLYLGFHAKLSDARRFFARFHTMTIAVAEKRSKRLVLELNYKADFGFLGARLKDHSKVPLRPIDRRIQAKQKARGLRDALRNINVINPRQPDPKYFYKAKGKHLLKGQYEQWVAPPMCSDPKILRGPQFDIKNPQTALRTARSNARGMIRLGQKRHDIWMENSGTNRDVRFRKLKFNWRLCKLGRMPRNGVFYTDVYGKRRLRGPGRGAVRQYMKPGLRLFFPGGLYMADDTWLGVQKAGLINEMRDIAYGVSSRAN